MADSRRIVIEFLGKDKSLSSTARGATTTTSKLGDTLKRVGKVAALGLAAGLAVAGKQLFDATKMAIADEKAQAQLATTLKNTAGATDAQIASTEEWISAQGRALGVTDDELRPALQRMAEATGDVEQAQKQVAIAMDVAAGTGRSLKSVTEAMLRAQNGSVDGLSRYGIATKDANGETMSFNEVLNRMGKTFEGQAANSANTLEGKMGRLKLIFDETKEEIGAKLIPVLTDLADWFLNKGLPAISSFARKLQSMAKWAQENSNILIPLTTVLGSVATAIGVVVLATKAWTKAQALLNLVMKANPLVRVVTIVAALAAGLVVAYKRSETFRNIVNRAFAVVRAAAGALGSAFSGVQDKVGALVSAVAAIPDKLRALGDRFGDAGRALIGAFVNGLKNAGGVISGIAGNVWNAVKTMLNVAIDKINAALEFKISLPGPDLTINPPNIPHLAKGGIVNRPTLALIGEDGPEAVVPLSRKHAPNGAMPGGGTKVVFTGPVYGDPRAFAQFVVRELRKEKRLLGGTGLGLA